MKKVRVKRVFTADFRNKPWTIYENMAADKKLFQGHPKEDETYIFISATGNQLYFVLGRAEVTVRPGTRWERKSKLFDYRGWRIENGTFNPHMLEDYANCVGLSIGKKTFEEWYADRKAA